MAEEQSRVERERAAREQRERAAAAERESRARVRLEEEELAAARERQRRLEEERRRAEEAARLEAIRTAELERARSEAALRAAHESAEAEREHELRLATIRHTARARSLRVGAVAAGVAALAAFTALGVLELVVHPQRLAALRADHAYTTAGERTRADRAQELFRASEAARREIEALLRAREAVAAAPAPVSTGQAAPKPHVRRPVKKPGERPRPCADDHDPLNPCLSR